MEISTDKIKSLREQSGAGIMDCRSALMSCEGDIDKALEALRVKGLLKAQKKAERTTGAGLVEAYIHTAGRIGALIEVNCETDFVARTDEFKDLVHCLAMQVAAMNPQSISLKKIFLKIKSKKSSLTKSACCSSHISKTLPKPLMILSRRLSQKLEKILK